MQNKYNSEDLYYMAATLLLSECPMSKVVDCTGCEYLLVCYEENNPIFFFIPLVPNIKTTCLAKITAALN